MESEENDIYLGIAVMLVSIIGIVGNVITLLILKRDEDFRAMNNSRLHIGNLAVIDLIWSIRAIWRGIGFIDRKIAADTFLCQITSRIGTIHIPLTYTSHAVLALHRWQSLKALEVAGKCDRGFFPAGSLL